MSPTWTALWHTLVDPSLVVEQQWHQVVLDISGYRGQALNFGFGFDSMDPLHNDYEGWYLDDMAVVAHGVPVPGYDLTDSWVQAFSEDYPSPDREIHLDRVEATGVTPWQVTNDGEEQYSVAVAAHPVRDIPVVWVHYYTNTHGVRVGDVEYVALRRDGTTSLPLTKVTDNSGAALPGVEDYGPTVAVNPADGSTVIAWTHCLSCPVSLFFLTQDVHYAIYDRAGGVVAGPVALSTNTGIRVRDHSPAVETFLDGNVLIAWVHEDSVAPLRDVFYTVADRSGNTIKAVDNLSGSSDTPRGVRLARLADGNILVVWAEDVGGNDIFYAVVDSSGSVVKKPTNLTNYGPSLQFEVQFPEALGLADGNNIVAWTELDFGAGETRIAYAVLGGSYNLVRPPTTLPNPYNPSMNGAVSMVADEADAAILTWSALSPEFPSIKDVYHYHLYYARLDNQGNVLTAPTIYRQKRGSEIRSVHGYAVGELPPIRQVYLPVVLRGF
jgi:hypothetical protein